MERLHYSAGAATLGRHNPACCLIGGAISTLPVLGEIMDPSRRQSTVVGTIRMHGDRPIDVDLIGPMTFRHEEVRNGIR